MTEHHLSKHEYFVMINLPSGWKPMVRNDVEVSMFSSEAEARTVALKSRAVVAYGAEIFRIGAGEEV